jgi:Carboxypeptidase regulatory-like domain
MVPLRVTVLLLALCSVAASAAEPAPARLVVRCANADPCAVEGSLRLKRIGEPGTEVVAALRNSVTTLPGASGTWDIELQADGFWMPRQTLSVSGEQELTVWRTTPVRGRVTVAEKRDALPKALEIVVESAPEVSGTKIAKTTIECPVAADGAWQCALPAARVDLVLRAKSFTPQYKWDVRLSPSSPHDLGVMALRPASSLVAWLDRGTIASLGKPATARLLRMSMAGAGPEAVRLAQPVAEAAFHARGMVQLAPVGAGIYTLEVSAPGFATVRIEPIEIFERSESVLRRPIELGPPVTVRVQITPPRHPGGAPWRVSLSRTEPVLNRSTRVATGVADESGLFVVPGQSSGTYTIAVRDDADNGYANVDVTVGGPPESYHQLELETTTSEGKVTLGKKALRATLHFGGRDGAVRVKAVSDSSGAFSVVLPKPGKWLVGVEAPEEGVLAFVETTIVRDEPIEIVLPDTEVAGWVTGSDGRRLEGATVALSMFGRGAPLRSGADGTFRIRGVPVGRIDLQARDQRTGEESRFVRIDVAEGTRIADVELSLEPEPELRGIVTSNGSPLAGARVIAYLPEGGTLEKATTGVDGTFRVRVPERATEVILIAAAAGRTFQAYRRPVDAPARLELAPVGGTLRLRAPQSPSRRILYEGASIVTNELVQWAFAHEAPAGPDLVVRNMAPGAYRLCATIAGRGEVCRDGILARGGMLELAVE